MAYKELLENNNGIDEGKLLDGLEDLYRTLYDNKEFWTSWLGDRIGFMGDFFAPTDDEQKAAQGLASALGTIQDAMKLDTESEEA